MEETRVDLHNWPSPPNQPGGWVAPHGDPINRWIVRHLHASYEAPQIPPGTRAPDGRILKPRYKMRAYHVDLDGSYTGLPDHDDVLVHQVPPVGWWFIKRVDAEALARIERWKV